MSHGTREPHDDTAALRARRAVRRVVRGRRRGQSADIDTVSGATVTSQDYQQSLQAAIDAAHLS